MNLIEQQTAAKELPMQYLQQAVNGQNPNLTPWIATAELQRRTTMNQHMQAAKGPQGPQPTVKDQVEQKAGLMATQAAQQQQVAQAQQSSTPPGPVPGGIPQPEPQPEEPVMAARGGLMNAPVNFQFAHGGILGYAGDEDQGSRVRSRLPNESFEEYRQRIIALEEADAARADAVARARQEAERQQMMASRQASGQMLPRNPLLGTPAAPPAPTASSNASRPALPGQGITAALPKPPAPSPGAQRPPAQRPPAPGPVTPQAPPPQGQGQGLPDAMGPAGQAALKFSTEPTKERTLEDIIAEKRAIQKEAGTDQPMGVDESAQQARQDEIQKRREAQAKELAYSAYVQGLVGTPGSAKLAYDTSLATSLGQEGTYGQEKYKNLAELAAAKRKAAETQQTALETPAAAGRLASAAERKDKAYTAANIYGTQEQAKASKYSADKHAETALAVQKLQDRAAAARQGSSDQKQALAELAQLERSYDADIKSLESQLRPLVGLFTPDAKAQVKELNIQLELARDLKRRVRGDKGAAPAGTMTPPPPGAVRLKKG